MVAAIVEKLDFEDISESTKRACKVENKFIKWVMMLRTHEQIRQNFCMEDAIANQLGYYVYRLVDPRYQETFYVGKGAGNRVYQHVRAALEGYQALAEAEQEEEEAGTNVEAEPDLKLERIRAIWNAGLEVQHIIHRHGMNEPTALEVEAALIDAYPGLHNRITGYGSNDFGCMHIKEIESLYNVEEFVLEEPLILISISKSRREGDRNDLDCVRGMWPINPDRANEYNLVLAHDQGLVVGAFRPDRQRWIRFEEAPVEVQNRWPRPVPEGEEHRSLFEGSCAKPDVWTHYVKKRVPQYLRQRGARFPVRYVDPED
jgi:hypothetical protein